MDETNSQFNFQEKDNYNKQEKENWRQRLNSPRSVEACRSIGVEPRELFFVDFETFKNTNPEFRLLNREMQQLRFEHYEKLRLNTIKAVEDERNRIINALLQAVDESKFLSKSKFSSTLISQNQQQLQIPDDPHIKQIDENEKKLILKIKQRQKMEIQTMIEYELNQEIMKKDNEEKLWRQKAKEEQMKHELQKKQREQEEFRIKKQQEKNFLLKKELENQLSRTKNRLNFEQTKLLEYMEKEKTKKLTQIKKAEETKHRFVGLKFHSDKLFEEQQLRLAERQALLEQKEKERKDYEELRKAEIQREALKQKREAQLRLAQTRKEKENSQAQLKLKFELREERSLRKRAQFAHLREIALKIHKDKISQKFEEIAENNEKQKHEEERRVEEYARKMEMLEAKKAYSGASQQMLLKEKTEAKKRKEAKLLEAKLKQELETKQKAEEVKSKFNETEDRVLKRQKALEREMMFRQERTSQKELEKQKIIKRLNNKANYEKENVFNQLKEKEEKIEMLRLHKVKVIQKRKEVVEQVFMQKQEVMEKFDKIMKKNKGISPEDIKELFPDDQELYEKILTIRERSLERSKFGKISASAFDDSKGSTKDNIKGTNPKNDENNNVKNSEFFITKNTPTLKEAGNFTSFNTLANKKSALSAEEAKKKIDEFKSKLSQELNKIIQEEKEKEDERMKKYTEQLDEEIKKILEEAIAKERNESSKRIFLFNEDLAKKLKEFENKLKIEYNLNFQDNYSKKDSKGLIVHVAKENNKENEEENKNNVFAV